MGGLCWGDWAFEGIERRDRNCTYLETHRRRPLLAAEQVGGEAAGRENRR